MAAPAASAAPAAAGAGDKKLAPAAGKDDKKTLAPSAEAKKAQAKKSSSLVDSLQLPPLLDVWAMEAKDLTGSKPDAYVKVFLIDENGEKLTEKGKPLEFRSEVIKGTKAPVWYVKGEDQTSKDGRVKHAPEPDPTFASREYPKLCLDAKAVRLEVFGVAFFGDDFLGQVNIPFSEIPEVIGDVKEQMAAGKVHTQWYDLKPATVKPKPVTGQIRVRLAYKSGELKKKEAEEKLKAVGNTYKKERQQTAAADIDEKRKRDEEEKSFAAALGKETAAAKKILGATMATGSRWKGVITLDANSVTKQPASRHFLDFVVTRHLSVAAAKAADPTRPVNDKAAPRLAGEYITLASLQTGEKAETVELVLREKADIAVPAHKDKEGKEVAAGVRAGVVATVTPHADLFMREAVKKFKEMADAERQKREQALEEAKKRGEDTTLGVEPGSPAAGTGKGAKSLEEMFANSVRLFGAFNESMDELTGAVHEVTPDQVLTASEDLGHVKGSFVLMVGPRYEAALKAQQQAREALRKKDAEEEQKRFAAETAAYLETVDARIKAAVLALSTGSVWHGFVTAGKDKDKREGKYELKVSYRHKHLAHGTHVAARPTAFGHNQAIGIEVVRGDVEITDPKAAADAKAAGTGYTLPGATGSAAQKVYRCEIRVTYEDKDNKYRGVFDPATGQIAGFVYESRDAATINPIASFTLAKGGVPASAPAAAAPAPAAAAPAAAAPAAAKN